MQTVQVILIPWLYFLTISPVIILSAAFVSFMFYPLCPCFVFTNSVHNYHDLVRDEWINMGKFFEFAHFWTSFHRAWGRTDLEKSHQIFFIKNRFKLFIKNTFSFKILESRPIYSVLQNFDIEASFLGYIRSRIEQFYYKTITNC